MLFTRKSTHHPKPLLVLQAAQFAGLDQATALLRRVQVSSTEAERQSFNCGSSFRLFEFYTVKVAELVSFDHLDATKAKGKYRFWTQRLVVEVEVCLERKKSTIAKLTSDGFTETQELDRWESVQGSVWTYWVREGGNIIPSMPDEHVGPLRGDDLKSDEDLNLKTVMPLLT